MSDSSTILPFPITASISCLALSITCGWLINSARAHSVVKAAVSVPAINTSCKIYKIYHQLFIFNKLSVSRQAHGKLTLIKIDFDPIYVRCFYSKIKFVGKTVNIQPRVKIT